MEREIKSNGCYLSLIREKRPQRSMRVSDTYPEKARGQITPLPDVGVVEGLNCTQKVRHKTLGGVFYEVQL